MTARRVVASVACSYLLAAGCRSTAPSEVPEPRRCEPELAVPAAFEVTGSIEDRERDHTGVRVDLEADDGSELHYFSGIAGEFGEGFPDRGDVRLADGSTGHLSGGNAAWVLEWPSTPPCTPSAVLATGMGGRRFRDVLAEAGVLRTG